MFTVQRVSQTAPEMMAAPSFPHGFWRVPASGKKVGTPAFGVYEPEAAISLVRSQPGPRISKIVISSLANFVMLIPFPIKDFLLTITSNLFFLLSGNFDDCVHRADGAQWVNLTKLDQVPRADVVIWASDDSSFVTGI